MNSCRASYNCGGQVAFVFRLPAGQVEFSGLFLTLFNLLVSVKYGKCSKISNTLKLRTPKIIAENNFKNILKNRTLTFFDK